MNVVLGKNKPCVLQVVPEWEIYPGSGSKINLNSVWNICE